MHRSSGALSLVMIRIASKLPCVSVGKYPRLQPLDAGGASRFLVNPLQIHWRCLATVTARAGCSAAATHAANERRPHSECRGRRDACGHLGDDARGLKREPEHRRSTRFDRRYVAQVPHCRDRLRITHASCLDRRVAAGCCPWR